MGKSDYMDDIERDAARYRFLRDHATNPWPINGAKMVRVGYTGEGPTLDEAIDREIRHAVQANENAKS